MPDQPIAEANTRRELSDETVRLAAVAYIRAAWGLDHAIRPTEVELRGMRAGLEAAIEHGELCTDEWANSAEHPNWEAGWRAGLRRGRARYERKAPRDRPPEAA